MSYPAAIDIGRSLADALADELVLASQRLAGLAFDLAADETTLRRHMTSLQEIDHVSQMQLAVAEMLRNGDGSLEHLPLTDMADRVRKKIGTT